MGVTSGPEFFSWEVGNYAILETATEENLRYERTSSIGEINFTLINLFLKEKNKH